MNQSLAFKWLRVFSACVGFSLFVGANVLAAGSDEEVKFWPLVPGLGPETCGPLVVRERHGPFDYRNPPPQAIIDDVEKHHFTQRLRAMQKGKDDYVPGRDNPNQPRHGGDAGGKVAGGFSYTLHAFPNHARALQAIDLYSRKKGFDEKPPGAEHSVECFFERAIRFVPNDTTVRFLYADYLEARGRKADAEQQINLIHDETAKSPALAYNVGLFYAKRGVMDKALELARIAYGSGYTFPGLKAILLKNNRWDPLIEAPKQKLAPSPPAETAVSGRSSHDGQPSIPSENINNHETDRKVP